MCVSVKNIMAASYMGSLYEFKLIVIGKQVRYTLFLKWNLQFVCFKNVDEFWSLKFIHKLRGKN